MFHNNALNSIDEQLLTDLTAEQSAIVEGGKTLTIHDIYAVKACADYKSADDTYIKINNKKVWGENSMLTGTYRNVNVSQNFSDYASVSLFDEDWGNDDLLGNFVASDPVQGAYATVSGSGSTYKIRYSVTA